MNLDLKEVGKSFLIGLVAIITFPLWLPFMVVALVGAIVQEFLA